MTSLNRLLAIRAAAAGPYRITGVCHDCGENEGLVNFLRPFLPAIAICRRCRFTRTGIEDRRGMIRATARISSPEELTDGTTTCAPSGRESAPAPEIRPPGLFAAAIVPESERSHSLVEPSLTDAIREAREILNAQEIHLSPRSAREILGIDADDLEIDRQIAAEEAAEPEEDDIFAPWTEADDEKRD